MSIAKVFIKYLVAQMEKIWIILLSPTPRANNAFCYYHVSILFLEFFYIPKFALRHNMFVETIGFTT